MESLRGVATELDVLIIIFIYYFKEMLKKRKQLMYEKNEDLVKDIENNTNFLIDKRKKRIRSTKGKLLFRTREAGSNMGLNIIRD